MRIKTKAIITMQNSYKHLSSQPPAVGEGGVRRPGTESGWGQDGPYTESSILTAPGRCNDRTAPYHTGEEAGAESGEVPWQGVTSWPGGESQDPNP